MRKNLILSTMAFAALAFVGCSSEDVLSEAPIENKAIEFGTYLGRDAQKRASVVDINSLATQGFGVYAYYTKNTEYTTSSTTSANFMKNQKVISNDNGSTWTYSPLKYWPNNEGDKVSFFAYAPYVASPTVVSDKPSLTFTVANKATEQTDLLWSKTDNMNLNMAKPDITTKVNFTFAHALSRIGFTVQAAVDQIAAGKDLDVNTTITVEKVMLSGAAHTYSNGSATESTTGAFYSSGVLNLNNSNDAASWSGTGTQYFTLEGTGDEGNLQNNVIQGGTNTNTQKQLNKDNSYLMIIPQDFSSTDFYVYVKYKVTTTDTNLEGGKSEITNYISTPVKMNFQSGKAYTLNLVLGLTSVKVSASVNDWGTPTETTVDLPKNTEATTPANPQS